MSGYYNIPGIPEQVFLTFTDWIGYVKDDGSFGYILQNGVPVAGDWSTITNKPATFAPTIGTTSITAKAGNYSPSWSEINAVIPVNATFPAILGTSATAAKPGNWYPDWSEITNKPDAPETTWSNITGKPTTLSGYGITDGMTYEMVASILSQYVTYTGLSYKADIDYVDQQFVLKQGVTDAALALKANTSDLTAKLNAPTVSYALRPLNTIFQVSSTRPASVSYSVELTVTASITGGQKGDVILEVSPSATFASGVQTVAISGLGQTYTLAIALQGVQPQTGCVAGFVPAGWYARLRTVNVTGSPTFSVRATQEATL